MTVKKKIEIDLPDCVVEEYDVVRCGFPRKGDRYLCGSDVLVASSDRPGTCLGGELGHERYRRIGFQEGLLYEPRQSQEVPR